MKEALKQYQEREPGVKSVLVGTRRADPHGGKCFLSIFVPFISHCDEIRSDMQCTGNLDLRTPTDDGWPRYQRVHPILNWSYEQIWEYLKRFEVPYCDLYNEGYVAHI